MVLDVNQIDRTIMAQPSSSQDQPSFISGCSIGSSDDTTLLLESASKKPYALSAVFDALSRLIYGDERKCLPASLADKP